MSQIFKISNQAAGSTTNLNNPDMFNWPNRGTKQIFVDLGPDASDATAFQEHQHVQEAKARGWITLDGERARLAEELKVTHLILSNPHELSLSKADFKAIVSLRYYYKSRLRSLGEEIDFEEGEEQIALPITPQPESSAGDNEFQKALALYQADRDVNIFKGIISEPFYRESKPYTSFYVRPTQLPAREFHLFKADLLSESGEAYRVSILDWSYAHPSSEMLASGDLQPGDIYIVISLEDLSLEQAEKIRYLIQSPDMHYVNRRSRKPNEAELNIYC